MLNEMNSVQENRYDRIATAHNRMMNINGYRRSVAKMLARLDLGLSRDSLVLDAGCGTGMVTIGLKLSGFELKQIVAADISINSLRIARAEFKKRKGEQEMAPLGGDVLNLPFADDTFNLIITSGVLEHVPLDKGLAELTRVLKPSGRLIILPVRPSILGRLLESLYKFETYPVESVIHAARRHLILKQTYDFPFYEPIGWSKLALVLEKP